MNDSVKSKHAFGNIENVKFAIKKGLIDSYDILFVKDANGNPSVGWIDANGNPVILENKTGIISVNTLPKVGEDNTVYICNSILYLWNGTDFESIIGGIAAEKIADWDAAKAKSLANEMEISRHNSRLSALENKTIIPTAKISEINLLSANWIGEASPYYQVVDIDGVTENSQVDLTPSIEQLVVFYEKDLGFVTENEDGIVTVYAIGQRPENDYTIQVTITEVSV